MFTRIYENNVLGKLDNNRYTRLASEYTKEQEELQEKVLGYEKELLGAEKKFAKHSCVKIDITFTAIGLFSIPDEAELLKIAERSKNTTQDFKELSA